MDLRTLFDTYARWRTSEHEANMKKISYKTPSLSGMTAAPRKIRQSASRSGTSLPLPSTTASTPAAFTQEGATKQIDKPWRPGDPWLGGPGSIANVLSAFMSPEDVAKLQASFAVGGTTFKPSKPAYSNILVNGALPGIPGELAGATRDYFLGRKRVNDIVNALGRFAKSQGGADMGPGFRFLQGIAQALKNATRVQGSMTRKSFTELQAQLEALQSAASTEEVSAPYLAMGQMLASPFFTQGNLFNYSKTPTGQYKFGDPNKLLFR